VKRSIRYLCVVLLIIFLVVGGICYRRFHYVSVQDDYYIPNRQHDSITRIAIIGDSWAYRAKQMGAEARIDSLFRQKGVRASTHISGQPGAKTSDIYQNLFSYQEPFGTRTLIEERPQYCIIFAGINDLHGQYGADYYAHHMQIILEFLIGHRITPIVIEIPAFDNESQYEKYNFTKRLCYRLLSFIKNFTFSLDNLEKYRNALECMIEEQDMLDKCIIIQTDSIFKGQIEYYDDSMHLNNKGYESLTNNIAFQLIKK